MDFLLNVGIDVSTSTTQFRADLDTIVSELTKTPPKIKVALTADQKSIENLRAQIESITKQLAGAGISTGTVNTANITAATNAARNSAAAHNADTAAKIASAAASKEVTNAANAEAQATKKVSDAEKQASSATASNGALLNRYATQIKKAEQGLQKWTKAEKSKNQNSREAYASLKSSTAATKMYHEQFRDKKMSADEFNKKLQELTETYRKSESTIRNNGDATKTWGERLGGLAKKFTQWFGVSQIIMQAYRTVKKMISISVELESAFAQLKIVTGATDAEMKQFKETAIDLAKSVGQSVTDVTKSIETFSRLGYNLQDSATLAKYASILSNTAAVSTDEATTGLTSIIKGFGMDVENSEHVADVLIEVGQKYAVSAGEMMEAYERAGAALSATNTSFEKSAGLIAAANAAVQNSSITGTALKTVSARIRGSKSDLEELGEDTTDLAEGFSKYAKEIKGLTGFNIMADEATGSFKDLYDIMEGISKVWDNLSDTQQARVAEILGGTRQLQVISSIITNWSDAAGAYSAAMDAAGVATTANNIVLNTTQAHLNQLKATFQELSTTVFESDFLAMIIKIANALLSVIGGVVKLINKFGGLKTILVAVISVLAIYKAEMIASFVTTILGIVRKAFVFLFSWLGKLPTLLVTLKNNLYVARIGWQLYAKGTISASAAMQASIPIIGWVMAALTALIGIFSAVNSASDEASQQAQNAAASAAETEKELSELMSRYNELSNTETMTSQAKEELSDVTDQLLAKFKAEGIAVDEVSQKYRNYSDALNASYLDVLRNSRIDLLGGVEAAKSALLDAAEELDAWNEIGNGPIRIHHIFWGEGSKDDNKNAALRGARAIIEKYGYVPFDNQLASAGDNGYTLYASGFMDSADDVIAAYDRLREMMELVNSEAGADNVLYADLYKAYSTLTPAVESYYEAVSNLNSNISEQHILQALQGKEIPKTKEEFESLRNQILNTAKASGEFIGSEKEIEASIDSQLKKTGLFSQFYKSEADAASDAAKATVKQAQERITAIKKEQSALATAIMNHKELEKYQNEGVDISKYIEPSSNFPDELDNADKILSIFNNTLPQTEEMTNAINLQKSSVKELADEYNKLVNGNVDYNNRPIVGSQIMLENGWDEFQDGAAATTFDADYVLNGGKANLTYTVKTTPILENGEVLTPEELDSYVEDELWAIMENGGGMDDILEYDKEHYGVVINIEDGISVRDNDGLTELDKKLKKIKDIHLDKYFGNLANAEQGASLASNSLSSRLEELYNKFAINKDKIEELEGVILRGGYSDEEIRSTMLSFSDGLELLKKVYSDVENGGDFDFSSVINNEDFKKAFGNLDIYGNAYSDFIQVVTSSPDDIKRCQNAFDKLATAYIYNSDALVNVTDETRDYAVALLTQNGVSNAAAIVDVMLATNKERAKHSTKSLTDMTWTEIASLYSECEAGGEVNQTLLQLALTKAKVEGYHIDSTKDVQQLIALAKAAGVTGQALANLSKAEQLMNNASVVAGQIKTLQAKWDNNTGQIRRNPDLYNGMLTELKQQIDRYKSEANRLLTENINYNNIKFPSLSGFGSGSSSSGSGSSSSSKIETWFEKQLAEHKHNVAMEKETQEQYINWLETNAKKAYNEGILDLKNYRSYLEEVYKGRQNIFKDKLGDFEHNISLREDYENESKNILEIYKKLLSQVEDALAAARKQGLTDNDDYVQDLQDKWTSYRDAIKKVEDDATDDAKDALDDLLDYQKDKLKQDVEDQKDTLDKKLDYLKDFYDKQKEMLQDQYDEEKYLKEQAEKRKTVSDISAQLEQLAFDNSAWAMKKKAELQQELADAQDELDEFEKEHALDSALDTLDKAYDDQEKLINDQIEALDKELNDPELLLNKALEAIKNNTGSLYEEMLEYNRRYGSGDDEDVRKTYEEAYKALLAFKQLFGEDYKGINLPNSTGYKSDNGKWSDSNINGNDTKGSTSSSSNSSSSSSASKSVPKVGDSVKIKTTATKFTSGTKMASWVPGGSFKVLEVGANSVRIGNSNGETTGWVKLTDIVGYASGTKNATAGIHAIDEQGDEMVFESKDGSRYRIFSGGEKVLNAKATSFLYDFAMSGGRLLEKIFSGFFDNRMLEKVSPKTYNTEVVMGDIIVQGNADRATISEIRREQRAALDNMLKEINRLNK